MKAPSIPADETRRLVALHRLAILDTAPEESLDLVTRLAAKVLRVPTMLISLVDSDRQWFKSCVGMDATESSRDVSFCGHVVYERRPLVIRDATQDPRFADNPLVTGAPHIRAYMGVPLSTLDNQPIGTLCAIDYQSHEFGADDLETLGSFAMILEEFLHAKELSVQTNRVVEFARERDARFRETFELAAVGILHSTMDGRLIRVNGRACEILGYSAEELKSVPFIGITHPDDVAENMENLRRLKAGEVENFRMEKRLLRKDGAYEWVYLSVALKRDVDGRPDYMIAVMEDISEKKRAEQALVEARDSLEAEVRKQTQLLRDQNQTLRTQISRVLSSETAQRAAETRLRAIADHIPALIGYWNSQLVCEFANEAYRAWFGLAPGEVVGMPMQDLIGDSLFKKTEPHARLALSGHEQHFQRTLVKIDGCTSFIDARYLPDIDESGKINGFYVQAIDITELRRAQSELEEVNARLRHDSTTDYLTGIANRRVFTERSEEAAQQFRDRGAPYALILLDVDNFKDVNDHFGHEVGDRVLSAMGRVLRDQLRGRTDLAARLGGEEFAVLCFGDLDEEKLRQLAERIRSHLKAETVRTEKGAVSVTCSFGVALSNSDDHDWKGMYARADAALYEAKTSGKDRVIFGNVITKGMTGRFRSLRVAPNH
jgi:diguanylate cyclase